MACILTLNYKDPFYNLYLVTINDYYDIIYFVHENYSFCKIIGFISIFDYKKEKTWQFHLKWAI